MIVPVPIYYGISHGNPIGHFLLGNSIEWTVEATPVSDCGSNVLFLPSSKMIDSICHTHTIWTSLYPPSSWKILHSRSMMSRNPIVVCSHSCEHRHRQPCHRGNSSHCCHCIPLYIHWEQWTHHRCELSFEDREIIFFVLWNSKNLFHRESPPHLGVFSRGYSGGSPQRTFPRTHGRRMVFSILCINCCCSVFDSRWLYCSK